MRPVVGRPAPFIFSWGQPARRVSTGATTTERKTVSPSYFPDTLAKVQEKIFNEFVSESTHGGVDPSTVHFFYPPLIVGYYSAFRECILADGALTRRQKEILGSFVSSFNTCAFCTNIHQMLARQQGADGEEMQFAITENNPFLLSDRQIGEIISWIQPNQALNPPGLNKAPNIDPNEIPEILGTTFIYNYVNRVVDIFVTNGAVLPAVPGVIRYFYYRLKCVKGAVDDWMLNSVYLKTPIVPGESTDLMNCFPALPEDMSWAKYSKPVSQAFAYWAWAVDALAEKYLSPKVVDFVGWYIDEYYDGRKQSRSRAWVFQVAGDLDGSETERFAVSFMLLVSFSRFQIDDKMMANLETIFPNPDVRLAMCMWTSFRTARKIASWQYAASDLAENQNSTC